MHFHLNHDLPHQLDILFLCSSTTNQNATVTVSRFDKIEAKFYFLSPRITNNTAVHPKKKKKPTYLPNFSTKGRERANRNNFKCGLKIENFQQKNFNIFNIFSQKIDCGYFLEPPR